ncbi:MAG: Gldg family protein [Phototrophicaceae bacterium]|jgi:ABC-type uncharacterized transport system involved in gliding motility auxiliary subunit
MRDAKATVVMINRAALGTGIGFVGLALLFLAAISFAWYLEFNTLTVSTLLGGIGGLLAWALIAPKEFVATLSGRQARYSTSAVFAGILLLGILVLAYVFIQRQQIAIDATLGQNYTLSPNTAETIARIPDGRTVQITGFYTPAALPIREQDDLFLREYALIDPSKVQIVYIDPSEQPGVAQRFDLRGDGQIFISYLNPDGSVDFSTVQIVPIDGKQEREITGAINRLLNTQILTVYYVTGLGSLDATDTSQLGLTLFDNSLRTNGIRTGLLSLDQLLAVGQLIPDDAVTLILARPQQRLSEEQLALIDEYLRRSGGLLILADTAFVEDAFLAPDDPFNAYLQARYGLGVLPAVVVDAASSVQTPLDLIGYATYAEPPIGVNLPEADTFFRVARALLVSADKPSTVANGRVISTSPESYGETDLNSLFETNTFQYDAETDLTGPLDLVAWAWDSEGDNSRVVLIGDGDIATSGMIDSGAEGNIALLGESVRWLTGYQDQVTFGFAADPSRIPTIFVGARQIYFIGLLTIFLVPLSILAVGTLVWYRRTFA